MQSLDSEGILTFKKKITYSNVSYANLYGESQLLLIAIDDELIYYDLGENEVVKRVRFDFNISHFYLFVSVIVVVFTSAREVQVIDLVSGARLEPVPLTDRSLLTFDLEQGEAYSFEEETKQYLKSYDIAKRRERSLSLKFDAPIFIAEAHNNMLAAASENGKYLYFVEDCKTLALKVFERGLREARPLHISFSKYGRNIAASYEGKTIHIFNTKTESTFGVIKARSELKIDVEDLDLKGERACFVIDDSAGKVIRALLFNGGKAWIYKEKDGKMEVQGSLYNLEYY